MREASGSIKSTVMVNNNNIRHGSSVVMVEARA
jgi:hypothetical protein